MEALQLPRQTKARLVALLAEDQLDGGRLLERLRSLRGLEKISTCAAVLHLLAHLSLPEAEAERLLRGVVRHRVEMSRRLGRDPGLRVAAIDYLCNVKNLLRNPMIVERAELERTEKRAFTDALTELFNRGYFEHTLQHEIRRCKRSSAELSLLMLDLDSFKPVNDLYGHLLGDLVLKRTGCVVRRSVRETDVACRFGGEEFGVVLPETDRLGALTVADRIRRRLARSFVEQPLEGRVVKMTISGGIAVYPQDGEEPTTLIARADEALYQAKTLGRNRIIAYHSERRRTVRFPVRRSTRVTVTLEGKPLPGEIEPLNLSLDGALLASTGEWAAQAAVELTLADDTRHWVIAGRVVRVEPASSDSRRRLAVAFDRPISEECLGCHVVPRRLPDPIARSRR